MRICLLTPTFLPKIGGAEICIDQLARNFQRKGHDVVVVAQAARGPGSPLQGDYPVVRYPRPFSQSGGYLRLKLLLRRLHREHRFDVVNAHMAHPGGYVGTWFSSRYDVPLVITPHGGDIFHRSRFRQRPRVWSRIRQGLAQADAVIALSSYFETLISQLAPNQRIVPICNGVNNANLTAPAKLQPEHQARCGPRYIMALGRLVGRKGFDTAIAAFGEIAREFPDVKLVLVGDGPEREQLELLARSSGAADRVIFLGAVTGSRKVALLQNCLFTVVPSVEEDNMPLVLLEAFACGKPVLGSRLGGIPDLVVPGRTGQLCTPGDAREFATGMRLMLEDARYRRMENAAREQAQSLDWDRIADQYLALFDQTMTAGSQRRPAKVA